MLWTTAIPAQKWPIEPAHRNESVITGAVSTQAATIDLIRGLRSPAYRKLSTPRQVVRIERDLYLYYLRACTG